MRAGGATLRFSTWIYGHTLNEHRTSDRHQLDGRTDILKSTAMWGLIQARPNNHLHSLSRIAIGCNSLDVQPRYCNSFQLLHVSLEDHAQSIAIYIESAMASKSKTRAYYSANNFASTVSFCHVSVSGQQ